MVWRQNGTRPRPILMWGYLRQIAVVFYLCSLHFFNHFLTNFATSLLSGSLLAHRRVSRDVMMRSKLIEGASQIDMIPIFAVFAVIFAVMMMAFRRFFIVKYTTTTCYVSYLFRLSQILVLRHDNLLLWLNCWTLFRSGFLSYDSLSNPVQNVSVMLNVVEFHLIVPLWRFQVCWASIAWSGKWNWCRHWCTSVCSRRVFSLLLNIIISVRMLSFCYTLLHEKL